MQKAKNMTGVNISAVRPNTRRRRPKKPDTAGAHDRRAVDPPKGARIAVGVVDDPYGTAEGLQPVEVIRDDGVIIEDTEWKAPGQPKITVVRSIRTDPLAWMQSHGRIDEAEFLAGRHWQELHERSQLGSIQAVDTAKEPVDGGRFSDPMTDRQWAAAAKLRASMRAVIMEAPDADTGIGRARLIGDVLGEGMFIKDAARLRGLSSERQIRALATEFCKSLSVLAEHFGYSGDANVQKQKIRSWNNEETE